MLPTFDYDGEMLAASRALRTAEAAALQKPGCRIAKLAESHARTWHDYLARQLREIAITRADSAAGLTGSRPLPSPANDQILLGAAD